MRVSVLGGGPAGLAAAHELARRGASVCVVEASDRVGGLARSLALWGRRVDLGSHVLDDSDPLTRDLLDEVLPGRMHEVPLRRGVLVDDRCYRYPFRPTDIIRRSAPATIGAVGLGYCARRWVPPGPAGSAEAWMVRRYGRAAYGRFFAPYAEKRAGIDGGALDESFAAALAGDSDAPARTFRPAPGAAAHRSTFRAPDGGMGALADALADRVVAHGGQLRTASRVRALTGQISGFVVTTDSGDDRVDAVVATVPLPALVSVLDSERIDADRDAVAGFVPRATVLVYVEHHGDSFPELWRYVNDRSLRVGRVANLDRWGTRGDGAGILCCELWCTPGDTTWEASDGALAARVVTELTALGMVTRGATARTHVERLTATHVAPLVGAPARVARLRRRLGSLPGLHLAGTALGVTDVGAAIASGVRAARAATSVLDLDGGSTHAFSRSR